jgi:muconate cycloisomerase
LKIISIEAGRDPTSIAALTAQMDQLIKRNAYAKGAVETACVDLATKAAGLSADALFGGRVREQIPILWVLATGDAEKDIEEAEKKLEQRLHKLFLVKIGHGDPLTDVARAVAVKRALGDHASIRVDVNQAWDEATATRAIAELFDNAEAFVARYRGNVGFTGQSGVSSGFAR